jgi:hypothetical protein
MMKRAKGATSGVVPNGNKLGTSMHYRVKYKLTDLTNRLEGRPEVLAGQARAGTMQVPYDLWRRNK